MEDKSPFVSVSNGKLRSALAQQRAPSSSMAELAKWGSEPGLSGLELSVLWRGQLASRTLSTRLQVVRDHGEQALLSQCRATEAMGRERESTQLVGMKTLLKECSHFSHESHKPDTSTRY